MLSAALAWASLRVATIHMELTRTHPCAWVSRALMGVSKATDLEAPLLWFDGGDHCTATDEVSSQPALCWQHRAGWNVSLNIQNPQWQKGRENWLCRADLRWAWTVERIYRCAGTSAACTCFCAGSLYQQREFLGLFTCFSVNDGLSSVCCCVFNPRLNWNRASLSQCGSGSVHQFYAQVGTNRWDCRRWLKVLYNASRKVDPRAPMEDPMRCVWFCFHACVKLCSVFVSPSSCLRGASQRRGGFLSEGEWSEVFALSVGCIRASAGQDLWLSKAADVRCSSGHSSFPIKTNTIQPTELVCWCVPAGALIG